MSATNTILFALATTLVAAGCGGTDEPDPPVDAQPVDGLCQATGNPCPSYEVTGLDIVCDLDNSTGTNLVEDSRLEFGPGPDDAILFTAPESGDYDIDIDVEPSTNQGCGVTAFDADMNVHTPADCPAGGSTVDLDGFYTGGEEFPLTLTAGQEVLLFVGCTYWSDAQSGPYQLHIRKL